MAAGRTSHVKTQRTQGLIAFLISAACEWFLISLLFIDALLSYLLTKFASYFELQAPCVFCSRLDRVLSGENPEYYQTLLCNNHRSEISSLISCHIHNKVADGHGMCDDCLFSFTAKTKADPITQRLLVGKLGLDRGDCNFESSSRRDFSSGSFGSRPCTCCGKLWKLGQNAQGSFQHQSPGSAGSDSCIHLPRAPRQSHLNNCCNSKCCRSVTSLCGGQNSCDSLSSYVGFTELKLISDSQSEFPLSDNDNATSVIRENKEAGTHHTCQCTSVISSKFLPKDSYLAEPNCGSPNQMPSLSDPRMDPNISKHHDVKFLGSDSVNDQDEFNCQQVNKQSLGSDLPKLVPLNDVSPSLDSMNISNGQLEKRKSMTLDATHLVGASPEKSIDASKASDNGLQSIKNHEEGLKKISTSAGACNETDLMVNSPTYASPSHKFLISTSKFSVIAKERELDRVKEELKLLSSPRSSPRWSHLSNMSLGIPLNDAYLPETPSSNGTQALHKSVSVDTGLGSLAGSNTNEIEGEPLVDQLKRQIKHAKKCMSSLYKELEEERNAAAIAANEAMSMINRLQEERSILQMEALQYLRMMEEQAEHDAEALEKADILLSEKEKEIQDLEAEIEIYRMNLTDEPVAENINGQTEETYMSVQKTFNTYNGCLTYQDGSV